MGSTSYDGVEDEPFEPDWAGGSWYGSGSGTYWRVNPKEYADPRKHGPEYQARGRRTTSGTGPGRSRDSAAPSPGASEASGSTWTEAANPAWSAGTTARAPGGQAWTDWRRAGEGAPSGNSWQESWPDDPEPADGDEAIGFAVPGWISGPVARRVVPILLGWPPLGFVLAALLGELTGCGRFSAGCSDAAGVLPWLVQPLVIGLLLALPFLANVAAIGTIGAFLAGIPVAAVLSVTGGGRGPVFTTSMVLVSALAVGYVIGVAGAAAGRFRLPDASRRSAVDSS